MPAGTHGAVPGVSPEMLYFAASRSSTWIGDSLCRKPWSAIESVTVTAGRAFTPRHKAEVRED